MVQEKVSSLLTKPKHDVTKKVFGLMYAEI